ncbi:hypothetical protein PR048_012652 [Dryococelus australis]|uniref:DDE-1 domain-containing protein n=1 Tax=Dryococelus australis TaxID=614101 RepID=A0ABQ9HPZ1_9NEOP|nr:hypothetical protein PR048_012652 [Dryococelus australis]
MTSEFFEKWLVKLYKKMSKQKQEVLFFIGNCIAHKSIPVLKNVKVPTDQGVIKNFNFKHFYRQLVENILTANEDKRHFGCVTVHGKKLKARQMQIVSRTLDLHNEETKMTSKIKIKEVTTRRSCQLWEVLET